MPFFETGEARIYYEVHGKGPPLLLLNGIMMSTVSWTAFVPEMSRRFELILLDFRDQGQSSKMSEFYTQDIHAGDIDRLFEHLKRPKAHIMGLSYGGQVALRLALLHPGRVQSLCLFNTPGRISRRLIEIGKAWETAAALYDADKFFELALPFIYSEPFYETHPEFLSERRKAFRSLLTREWFDSFVRLSRSAEHFSVSPEDLRALAIPVLLAGAGQDTVVSQNAMRILQENIPGCEFLMIPDTGHAAFLEKMNEFLTILIGFVTKNAPDAGA